jgi:excisionase family DNA binding protein
VKRKRASTMVRSAPALLSVREAAWLLGVGKSTLYRAIEQGNCPLPCVVLGKQIRIARVAVERLLAGDPLVTCSVGATEAESAARFD